MKSALLYIFDKEQEQEIPVQAVDHNLSLGKSANADLQIDDWRCNGIHAMIRKEGPHYTLYDLGSSHGTFVNGQSIASHDLYEGDKIFIGDQRFIFRSNHSKVLNLPTSQEKDLHEILKQEKKSQKIIDDSVLEVSLYWGEQLLEVQSFHKDKIITVGDPKKATFAVPYQNNKHPDAYPLASYKKGLLTFDIPDEANGLLWLEGKVTSLDGLRFFDEKFKNKKNINLKLGVEDKAHIEFSELTLVFKFIRPSEKIPLSFFPGLDRQLTKIILGIVIFYALILGLLATSEPEIKETKIEDIPKRLRKVVYQAGIKNADKQRQAAIGQIAKTMGGRARAEEGKSSSKKSLKKKEKTTKKKNKKVAKKPKSKSPTKAITKTKSKKSAPKVKLLDLDSTFADSSVSQTVAQTTIISKVKKSGNTASALSEGGFARGRKGLGAGGAGKSVGIGALEGKGTGGGLGAGDYGIVPSKGAEIKIPEQEEIRILGGLDPDIIAQYIKGYLPQIKHCYEQQLAQKPKLAGKVTVKFTITGNGTVAQEKVVESSLKDRPTESCMLKKISKWTFPKPRGGGTVGVKYPFILQSNTGN